MEVPREVIMDSPGVSSGARSSGSAHRVATLSAARAGETSEAAGCTSTEAAPPPRAVAACASRASIQRPEVCRSRESALLFVLLLHGLAAVRPQPRTQHQVVRRLLCCGQRGRADANGWQPAHTEDLRALGHEDVVEGAYEGICIFTDPRIVRELWLTTRVPLSVGTPQLLQAILQAPRFTRRVAWVRRIRLGELAGSQQLVGCCTWLEVPVTCESQRQARCKPASALRCQGCVDDHHLR
mmetsp:Transcript_58865/g.137063  ORF Transcript_58865/g.137063 Transcript_58865/m.137063 type:complete len:240 (+) Transcript_58865:150-869(+)